jgi:hypothetical protein
VSWRIDSQPQGAELVRLRDGVVLGKTPWQSVAPFAAGTEELRLRLPGYVDRDVSISKSAHVELRERLDPESHESMGIGDSADARKGPNDVKSTSYRKRRKQPKAEKEYVQTHEHGPVQLEE